MRLLACNECKDKNDDADDKSKQECEVEPCREHLHPDMCRCFLCYPVVTGDRDNPLDENKIEMAIPIVIGANRSRLVRLETIPGYFLETEFMIMFDAGVIIRPSPKPIRPGTVPQTRWSCSPG